MRLQLAGEGGQCAPAISRGAAPSGADRTPSTRKTSSGSSDGHVVLLGSGTHWGGSRSLWLVAPPRWEDPADLARPDLGDDADRPVAGQRAYATSKLAVVLLCTPCGIAGFGSPSTTRD